MLANKDLLFAMKTLMNSDKNNLKAYSCGEQNYSHAELSELVRDQLRELGGDYNAYKRNKDVIFSLIEETINDVLPKKVMEQFGQFADIKTFAQNTKPVFTQRVTERSKRRAKQFIGKVGLAGVYEVFKLDGQAYEVATNATGAAAQIGFEEMLDGRWDFADFTEIIMQGLNECIYEEIQAALIEFTSSLQASNYYAFAGFDEDTMDKAISVAQAYGQPTIYCTYEFASKMWPSDARMSEAMKNDRWNNGYYARYKTCQVVILPQSFVDETNTEKVVDPAFAWIIPTGAEKPVKIAFEGDTHVRERENEDWSRDIQVYKKYGVRIVGSNNIVVYKNENLTKTL